MKQKTLYLCVGIPGSGKSYWVHNQLDASLDSTVISRDAMRFAILKPEEDYFAHEDEVFDIFIDGINEALSNEYVKNIYVDATHLTARARAKVLNRLKLNDAKLVALNFKTPVETCLTRNAARKGRARVPDSVIRRMSYQIHYVEEDEGQFHYDEIINIKGE